MYLNASETWLVVKPRSMIPDLGVKNESNEGSKRKDKKGKVLTLTYNEAVSDLIMIVLFSVAKRLQPHY